MRKILLNVILGETLSLVKKLSYFDNPIQLDVLIVSSIHLSFHDLFNGILLIQSILSSIGVKCSSTFEASKRGGNYIESSSTLKTRRKLKKGVTLNSNSFSHTTFVML